MPKAQWTQGIKYFDSFNTCNSKEKFQQALKSWSNFSLVFFDKGRGIQRKTLTTFIHVAYLINPGINLEKSMYNFCQIHLTTSRNPCNHFGKYNNLYKI